MFRKTTCSNCNKEYDATYDCCPKCRQANLDQPDGFSNMTMVRWGKQIALFLVGWLGLQVIATIIELIILKVSGASTVEEIKALFSRGDVNMKINGFTYLTLLVTLSLIMFDEFPKLFKTVRSWKPYVAAAAAVGLIFFFNIAYGMLLSALKLGITNNENEASLESITDIYPLLSVIVFGVIGPICEELTYRVGLFSFLKRFNKYVGYIITLLIFAFIHFSFTSGNLINELLNLPYYLCGGLILTLVYDKFGFAGSVTAHILNNLISLLLCSAAGLSLFIL